MGKKIMKMKWNGNENTSEKERNNVEI